MTQIVYARALFNFEPEYADELEIKAGEILQILYEINEDWIYAKSLMLNENSLIGILPKSFVQILDIPWSLVNAAPALYLTIEDFDFYESGDLAIRKNEIIASESEVDENWLFGFSVTNPSKTGIYPKTHVRRVYFELSTQYSNKMNNEILCISKSPVSLIDEPLISGSADNSRNENNWPNREQKQQIAYFDSVNREQDLHERRYCVVNFDFIPNEPGNFLSCRNGECLIVISTIDEFWIIAENEWATRGLVPISYVTILIKEFSEFTKVFQKKSQISESNTDGKHQLIGPKKLTENTTALEATLMPLSRPPIAPKPKIAKNKNEPSPHQYQSAIEVEKEKVEATPIEHNNKKSMERKYSIDELYRTEKDFCTELTYLYDAFMNDCQIPADFDKSSLFNELTFVLKVSSQLVSRLKEEMDCEKEDEIKIGLCLLESSENMKMTYAKYLQNHSNIDLLIKKYESIPRINDYINVRLETLRNKCKVPTLQSLLIKPVQRIFKYPLFLKRILDNTDKYHTDHANLEQALDKFTKILEFINEYKRRKDLISKYLAPGSNSEQTSITDMMKKINLKTLKKKTTRMSVQFSNIFGIHSQQIIDEAFYQEEANFRLAEKAMLAFHNNLREFLSNLKYQVAELNYCNSLPEMGFDDENYYFLKKSSELRIHQVKEYAQFLKKKVLLGLESLVYFLVGPNKLIEKRKDKLFDYQASLYELQKLRGNYEPSGYNFKEELYCVKLENDSEVSRKDYEALNNQLIEELPLLTHKIIRLLILNLMSFCEITWKYFRSCSFSSAINNSDLLYQTEENRVLLRETFEIERLFYVITEDASEKISLVGMLRTCISQKEHFRMVHSGQRQGLLPCNILEPARPTQHSAIQYCLNLNNKEFCVAIFDFKAVMANMLNLKDGEVYQVVEKQDKHGNSDWWMVKSTNASYGYVPRTHVKLLE